jgi:hypothetical protein
VWWMILILSSIVMRWVTNEVTNNRAVFVRHTAELPHMPNSQDAQLGDKPSLTSASSFLPLFLLGMEYLFDSSQPLDIPLPPYLLTSALKILLPAVIHVSIP